MRIDRLGMAMAMAALVLVSPVVAKSQEVHTISPHFPDHFKLRTTSIGDQDQVSQGKHQTTHSEMETLADIQKLPVGYRAVYSLVNMKSVGLGPDGRPTAQGQQMEKMVQMFRDIGTAQVTMDDNLDPVTVDNIEDIKAKLKLAMTSTPEMQKDNAGEKVYALMFGSLTPQSAGAFLKMAKRQGNVYNRPLPLGQAVALSSAPMQFMGTSFNLNSTVELTRWEEGKTAHLMLVMAPTDADMQRFLGGLLKNMMASLMPPDDGKGTNAQMNQVMDRMVANMKMAMKTTCDVDIDLNNDINTHVVCAGETDMSMDLRKILPDDVLKAHPEVGAKLPLITMVQTSHSTNDTSLVQ